VTVAEVPDKSVGDSTMFKPLVETTAVNFTVKEVPADKAYLSHDNLATVNALGATAFVPFKSNSTPGESGSLWQTMYHYFQFRREEFLQHYHARSNAESTFSAIKRKFGDAVRSKTDVAMRNEVLCKFLCHNICVVIMEQCVLGIDAEFWPEEQPTNADPAVLRFPAI
jgi:transposase